MRHIAAERLETYRRRAAAADYASWCEHHADHLAEFIRIDLPETFLAINRTAALPAAVSSERGAGQTLVRVEALAPALEGGDFGHVDDAAKMLADYIGGNDDARGNAKSYLENRRDHQQGRRFRGQGGGTA